MRGIEDYNYPLFNAVTAALRMLGWKVHNPAENDGKVDQDALDRQVNPLKEYMKQDLKDVCDSDVVFALHGWDGSKGASLEVHVAHETSTPVIDWETGEEVPPPMSKFWLQEEQVVTYGPDDVMINPRTGEQYTVQQARWSATVLPVGSQDRKDTPITTGVLDYFPAALAAVARVSKSGNDKHNPGEPLHWARSKSADQADAIGRHLLERGGVDPDTGLRHSAQLAWRSLALLQIELEEAGEAPMARGAEA
jgi:hypothetical protein